MSTAAPRSCLKPPIRNPWVAEDGGESSTTSSSHHQQQHLRNPSSLGAASNESNVLQQPLHHSHDFIAPQYATPFSSTSTSYVTAGNHPITVVTGVRPTHQPHSGSHGVVHSHTAHSLHSASHSIPAAAFSVHSVPGTIQQPWGDPQMLWSTPALPGVGVGGGVFTVGGSGKIDGSCPSLPPGAYPQPHPVLHTLHSVHPGGGSSGQASSSAGGGGGSWAAAPVPGTCPQYHPQNVASSGGRTLGSASENWSRCEKCHYYCFRAAQAAFVAGIVTGFSLLVAGGVFHRQHVNHLQVLIYIGAMVSLVCVVLLVIFCAMNKDNRTRRGISGRSSGPQVNVGDPETVPLRPVDVNNPPVIITENMSSHGGHVDVMSGISANDHLHRTNHTSCVVSPVSHNSCMGQTSQSACCGIQSNQGGCIMGPVSQNVCFIGPPNPSIGKLGNVNKEHISVASSESSHFITRHPSQRINDDQESNENYNRLWKQQSKASSEGISKL